MQALPLTTNRPWMGGVVALAELAARLLPVPQRTAALAMMDTPASNACVSGNGSEDGHE
jgi:hypothetical protein